MGMRLAGFGLPAIEVPLATYAGWNVRHADIGGEGQTLAPGGTVVGGAIPFAVTREERLASGDPRASIEERYGSRDEYLERVRACAESLVEWGYVLAEDRGRFGGAGRRGVRRDRAGAGGGGGG